MCVCTTLTQSENIPIDSYTRKFKTMARAYCAPSFLPLFYSPSFSLHILFFSLYPLSPSFFLSVSPFSSSSPPFSFFSLSFSFSSFFLPSLPLPSFPRLYFLEAVSH